MLKAFVALGMGCFNVMAGLASLAQVDELSSLSVRSARVQHVGTDVFGSNVVCPRTLRWFVCMA